MAQIDVSDKVKDVLLGLQASGQHKSMDSVIRAMLFKIGIVDPITMEREGG